MQEPLREQNLPEISELYVKNCFHRPEADVTRITMTLTGEDERMFDLAAGTRYHILGFPLCWATDTHLPDSAFF